MGIDFNPTFFSHEKAAKLTLSIPDEEIRRFWIRHGQACIRISRYFAEELGQSCVMNIWIPDGYKDILADRLGPRARFKDSLDQILSIPYDRFKVLEEVELTREKVLERIEKRPGSTQKQLTENDHNYLFDHLPEELVSYMEEVRLGKREL